jgi:hypothetical protein
MSQYYSLPEATINSTTPPTTPPYSMGTAPPEEKENVIYIDSFFIPYVGEHITLDKLVELIESSSPYKGEGDTSIGIVEKIESIPKVNPKTGRAYYSCFVTLRSWSNNDCAHELMMRLYDDKQSRLFFKDGNNVIPQYFYILPNKSETSMMDAPTHTDLVMYLHTDVRLETVLSVIEGLDIGKVHSIEAGMIPNRFNENTCPLKWVNQDIWRQKVNFQYNMVFITMEYWYKTQTAYAFKREMQDSTYVEIPVYDGSTWTIYESAPRLAGVNPYVWERND